VQYTHGVFNAQLRMIRDFYQIGPGEIDQPGFPLFGLFATALGAKAIIPDMDPSRPAQLAPAKFVASIQEHQVSYSFGSPAIWNVVSNYCIARGLSLPIKKILMAGAPVSGELIERVASVMDPDGEIHTPYGATESLPIVNMTGQEILETTWQQTREGRGTCIGRPLPGIEIRIIRPQDGRIALWQETEEAVVGEIGEIVVQGEVVTRCYDNNENETLNAKIFDPENGSFWHRMGDMGYLDEEGRLWFCGRKAHRVLSENGPMYTICCEAIFNEHPRIRRSALVGIGQPGHQQPVLIAESRAKGKEAVQLLEELRHLGGSSDLTCSISHFLLHPDFPVDIRHNAKIFREKLAEWATKQLMS
jgi:acyl-CoA synthetase (AMP-forming)/AMP-acid ligase II